jgi:wyosine [tRNA(Phe)-imidazoG37] synthetase (radical SAM superfamily)
VVVAQRKEYAGVDEIIAELISWLHNNPQQAKQLRFITLSGLGEPTLNTRIGELISQIRTVSGANIAVITNSTLLGDSLDTVDAEIFKQIDRPCAGIELSEIIDGLAALRKEFRGKIWLEVMLVSGVNDDIRHIKVLSKSIQRINPDKIQLNSPLRSTAEKNVFPVEKAKLEKIREILGDKAEII